MRRGREIIGLPVVDLSDGQCIAKVVDLLYHPTENRVSALVLESSSPPRSSKVLRWESIYSLGADAVTVQGREAIAPVTEQSETPNKYLDKNVLTSSGRSLGRVEDVAIHPQTGSILGCVLTDGLVGDFLVGRPIIPLVENALLGEETMIVPDEPQVESARDGAYCFDEPAQRGKKRGVDDEVNSMPDV